MIFYIQLTFFSCIFSVLSWSPPVCFPLEPVGPCRAAEPAVCLPGTPVPPSGQTARVGTRAAAAPCRLFCLECFEALESGGCLSFVWGFFLFVSILCFFIILILQFCRYRASPSISFPPPPVLCRVFCNNLVLQL